MAKYYGYELEKALTPKEGLVDVMTNRFWSVKDNHLLFWNGTSPQCNANKNIAERVNRHGEIMFIKTVFIPLRSYYSSRFEEEITEPDYKKMKLMDMSTDYEKEGNG